jgi:hypothetical protein
MMGKSQSTTEQKLPDWQEKFMTGTAMPLAQQIADQPFQAYGGQFAPGMSSYTQQAGSAYQGMANQTPGQFNAAVQQNMSPYQQNVMDTALAQMTRQGDQARTGLEASLAGAGAFGSRGEVARGEFEAGLQGQRDALTAQMMQQGYTQALGTTQQQMQNRLAGAGGLMGVGSADTALQAAQLAGEQGEFMREQNYPYQQMQGLLGFGGGNYGGTTTESYNPGLLGIITSGLGAFSGMR